MYDYDAQIKRLTDNPRNIPNEWSACEGLFAYVGDMKHPDSGCLTMIRNGKGKRYKAVIKGEVDEELTLEIVNDDRIPPCSYGIRPEHLSVFKEWQERIHELQNS